MAHHQDTKRYWGNDVLSMTNSLSLDSLHETVRQKTFTDDSIDNVAMETESSFPVLTKYNMTGMTKRVHRQLPSWILCPRLITNDISSGSVSLTDTAAVELPHIIISNLKTMGYTSLLPVQVAVIPELLTYHDVCVCAPTGCGKTLCYVVPIVTNLLDCVVRQVRAIVVVPSRALARQVFGVFRDITSHTRVQCGLMCGEIGLEKEAAIITDNKSYPTSSKVDVVIVTPGRLTDHILRGSFSSLQYLRFLVIDEADKLLSQQIQSWLPRLLKQTTPTSLCSMSDWLKGRSELSHILPLLSSLTSSHLPTLSTPNHLITAKHLLSQFSSPLQKVLLSATMTQDPEALDMLQLHNPLLFSMAIPSSCREVMNLSPPSTLIETMVICMASLKPLALLHILCHHIPQSNICVLCFTNSRDTSMRLKIVLEHFNWFSVAMVTSEVGLSERKRILNQFRRRECQVLICSDTLSRGIDMPECNCVVNYDPPSIYSTYLHRVGRTARCGSVGLAFTLLTNEQITHFKQILRIAHRPNMEVLKVTSDLLQPLQTQYDQALTVLKNSV